MSWLSDNITLSNIVTGILGVCIGYGAYVNISNDIEYLNHRMDTIIIEMDETDQKVEKLDDKIYDIHLQCYEKQTAALMTTEIKGTIQL